MKLGPNFKYGSLMLIVVFAVSAAAMFGLAQLVDVEDITAEAGDGGPAGGPVSVRIVGKDLKFDRRSFTASPSASKEFAAPCKASG